MKRKLSVWKNIFANDTSDKDLVSKIYKEFIKLYTRKTKNPVKDTSLRRTYRGPTVYKRMLSITSHQRDGN